MTKTHFTSLMKTICLFITIFTVISFVSAVGSVPEGNIPTEYTLEQSTALNEIFNQIQSLIAGSAQMSTDEFNDLNSTISDYSSEQQSVLILLMQDTWDLTAGTAQMSEDEFENLKLKYHPDTIIQSNPTPPEQTSAPETQEQPQETQEESEEQNPLLDSPPSGPADNISIGDNTSPEQQDQKQEKQTETIKLNSPSNSNIYTKEAKTRLWIIYGFMIFAGIIIILLALRKL